MKEGVMNYSKDTKPGPGVNTQPDSLGESKLKTLASPPCIQEKKKWRRMTISVDTATLEAGLEETIPGGEEERRMELKASKLESRVEHLAETECIPARKERIKGRKEGALEGKETLISRKAKIATHLDEKVMIRKEEYERKMGEMEEHRKGNVENSRHLEEKRTIMGGKERIRGRKEVMIVGKEIGSKALNHSGKEQNNINH